MTHVSTDADHALAKACHTACALSGALRMRDPLSRNADHPLRGHITCHSADFGDDDGRSVGPMLPTVARSDRDAKTMHRRFDDNRATEADTTATFGDIPRQDVGLSITPNAQDCRPRNGRPHSTWNHKIHHRNHLHHNPNQTYDCKTNAQGLLRPWFQHGKRPETTTQRDKRKDENTVATFETVFPRPERFTCRTSRQQARGIRERG